MTSPPESVRVTCPKCGHRYEDWYRPSLNLRLEDFDEEYMEEASSAVCPECGTRVSFDVVVVEPDGSWRLK